MMRLIDADKAIENIMIRQYALKDRTGNVDSGLFTRDIERCIKEQPLFSPADVRPVVRCKDCKFGTNDHSGFVVCRMASYPNYTARNQNWYCADGERKGRDECCN